MKEFIKKFKITSLLLSIAYLVFGIVLIAWPNGAKLTIIYILSSLIVVHGVINVVNYFLYGYEPFGFMSGVLNVTFGLLLLGNADLLAGSAVFALTFGFVFIFRALGKIQNSFDYRRFGVKTWWLNMLFGVIMLILGVVVLAYPFASEKYLLIFLGAGIIVDSVMQIVSMCIITNKVKKIKHTLKGVFKGQVEEDVIDVTDYTIEKDD